MNKKNVLTVFKKELRGYFDSPTAYIVLAVFLFLWEFLFFRNVFLVGEASLRMLFDFLPWLFLILLPALTMGSISQEKSEGTLEWVLTHPIRETELLVGKFLATSAFVALALLFIFPIALGFSLASQPDWGVVVGQYLGSLFLGAIMAALGIFVSALVPSAISAMLLSAAIGFFFIIFGSEFITATLPAILTLPLSRLSTLTHFTSLTRGVVDLRDVWYFISGIVVFLSLAYLRLVKNKYGKQKRAYRNLQSGIFLLVGIAILTNVIGEKIPGRLDLTQNKLYTLSPMTKETLKNLDDVVNVTVFASSQLPAQLQPVQREVRDVLRDYQATGRGKLQVDYKNPSSDPQASQQATSLGIREVQFNMIGQEEFQVKTGFLGIAVSYGGQNEVIPFVQQVNDLEYQLTGIIKKLTNKDKKRIGFLTGQEEKSLYQDFQVFSEELKKQFTAEDVSIDEKNPKIDQNLALLVIANPTQALSDVAIKTIKEYLDNGGSVFFLIDGVEVNSQYMSASANSGVPDKLLAEYGLKVQKDMVYDLQANETVSLGGGGFGYLLPYPFWVKAQAVEGSTITAKIQTLTLAWPSSVEVEEDKAGKAGYQLEKLLETTKSGGKVKESFSISPNQKFSQDNLAQQLLAVALQKKEGKGRIVLVGDSEFLTDEFLNNSPQNLAFGLESLSWLAQEESLAGIKIKGGAYRPLLFTSPIQVILVKYGNLALCLIVPLVLGIVRMVRRRNLGKMIYR